MKPLEKCIAVVTGASRGAGRGCAVELGAAGATVYVTGRSRRERPAPGYERIQALSKLDRLPGSIDETADEVTHAGGRGIAVGCDHTDEAQVAALFERVEREHGRLDLLVNNAWGGHEVFEAYRAGLKDLEGFSHVILIWHIDRSRGGKLDATPPNETKSRGVFATRSPNRPNPIGLSIVELHGIEDGILQVERVDMLDGTPLLDIKPYIPVSDSVPDARAGWLGARGECA